jgi:hypothetical protein
MKFQFESFFQSIYFINHNLKLIKIFTFSIYLKNHIHFKHEL